MSQRLYYDVFHGACSKPDLAFVISAVSMYMADPGIAHYKAFKFILRYIKGYMELRLLSRNHSAMEVPLRVSMTLIL